MAHHKDFPELWQKLQIGTRVQLRARAEGELMRVFEMRLFRIETPGCG